MKTKTYMDKSDWDEGPWQEEPDLAYWIDDATGYHCLINRTKTGILCGYVGIPENHPYVHRDDFDVELKVHGGITFAGSECHVDFGKHPEVAHAQSLIYAPAWWFGFDCAHSSDLMPTVKMNGLSSLALRDTYRTFDYVMLELMEMLKQLETIQLNQGTT